MRRVYMRKIFNVEGMSCRHCVNAITKALNALEGVAGVSVDLKAKTVTVDFDESKVSAGAIKSQIEEQGYDVLQ